MRYKALLWISIILISQGLPLYPAEETPDISLASQLQTPFIRNEGQLASDDVKFYTRLFNGAVFITDKGELVYNINYQKDYLGADDIFLPNGQASGQLSERIRETFVSGPDASGINIQGLIRAESYINYLTDRPETRRDYIPTYSMISLGEAWPGINIHLKANAKNIEKIFIVSPDGDAESIKIALDGIRQMLLAESGNLELKTPLGGVEFTRPVAYQEINGERKAVDAAYRIIDGATYGFSVGAYDRSLPLIIDPLLASTYIGGSGDDTATGIARDSAGNIFIVGSAQTGYPTTAGVYQSAFTFSYDAIVSKFNSTLTALLASTYIGSQSNRSEFGYGIAIDGSGNVFVTGAAGTVTTNPSSPASAGAYDTSFGGGWDAFAAKLNNNLTSAGFAFTFLGGTGTDLGYGIATDRNDNVFVCGVAGNSTFPAVGGPYTTFGGATQDGFVARFNNNLSGAGFISTFLGGTSGDICYGIAIDADDNVVVVGGTASSNFPTSPVVPALGSADVFVTKFNNALTATLYSTRLGGSAYDTGYGIAIGRSNNIYITGETASLNFPVSFTGISSLSGGIDAFITKLSPSLNILNSRYLGGSGSDYGWSLATAPFAEQIFLTGYTASSNFPTYPLSPAPLDTTLGGISDLFVTRLDNDFNIAASTYLGGAGSDSSTAFTNKAGIAVDNLGNPLITSVTLSSDFPLASPITTPYNGATANLGSNNIVCRITPDLSGGTPVTSAVLTPPIITFPANLTSNVLIPPVLQWTVPENAINPTIYYVYLSTDAYPLNLVYSGQDLSIPISAVAYETSYFWYIVASDSSGRFSWTAVSQFTTEVNPIYVSGSSGTESLGPNAFTKPLGSCFIATVVYGSPKHPNVLALKKFRDDYLSKNSPGRAFVQAYYKISPPIAEHLRNAPVQAAITRWALNPAVYAAKYPGAALLLISALFAWLILTARKHHKQNNA
jgi:hypothetical protein